MTAWRAKNMSLGEYAHFRGSFEQFYHGASQDKRLALFVRSQATHSKIVLIPGHRASLVELLSPGGWRDYDQANDEEWLLVVGDAGALNEMGLKGRSLVS